MDFKTNLPTKTLVEVQFIFNKYLSFHNLPNYLRK
jgi:hypothetical protein